MFIEFYIRVTKRTCEIQQKSAALFAFTYFGLTLTWKIFIDWIRCSDITYHCCLLLLITKQLVSESNWVCGFFFSLLNFSRQSDIWIPPWLFEEQLCGFFLFCFRRTKNNCFVLILIKKFSSISVYYFLSMNAQ